MSSTPSSTGASANADARIAIHLQPVDPGGACSRAEARPPCSGVEPTGRTQPDEYFAYVLVMKGNAAAGVAGMQFGIEYDGVAEQGVDVFYWAHCATLQFPSSGWPQSGTGNLITWNSQTVCQRDEPGGSGTGVVAVAGYFYLGAYTPDVLRIVPRQADGAAKVADCAANEDIIEDEDVQYDPSHLGFASFSADGSVPGYNPCDAPSVVPIDCTIAGPSSVLVGTSGNIYTAPNAPAGAGHLWWVDGSGSVVGPDTGPSVEVQAGSGTSFQVMVEVSDGGTSSTCQKSVSITTPSCAISGPSTVTPEATVTYYASTSLPGPVYAWSVTGDASINGPANGSSVSVTAGSAGGFTLRMDATSGSVTATCSRAVTIELPSCAISGPDRVGEGTAQIVYTPSTNVAATGYNWSITGNGAIVTVTSGGQAIVNAGDPGTFDLRLEITWASGPPIVCTRTVVVDPLACSIQGPDPVTEFSTLINYSTGPPLLEATYAWSIAGNGHFPGDTDESGVLVNAGAAGTFELTVIISRHGRSATCARTITVTPGSGCQPGRQSAAKIMVHLGSRFTKNPCGRAIPCTNVVTNGGLYPPELYFAYVLVGDADAGAGVGGMECGLDYDAPVTEGVDVFAWSLCATSESPVIGWPYPGGGNRITWSTCQRNEPAGAGSGVVAAAGYFYMGAYTADELSLEVHPGSGAARVYDCDGCESIVAPGREPSTLGFASFSATGTSPGYNPCGQLTVPVVSTTWSAIKALYGR